MTAVITRSTNPAIREVARGLAAARDEQILQVVAMVDAMPDRGPADQLIAPLRGRLARLRPARPLRFARLLFMPLDPLIVSAARWRPEQHTIPRTVIPVMAAMMEQALGRTGRAVMGMIEGHTTQNDVVIEAAGGLLWDTAGQLLLNAPLPARWETTGLNVAIHRPLSRRVGALLSQAVRLHHMTTDAAQGLVPPDVNAVHALLTAAVALDPDVQPMLLTLLFARIPECGPILERVATMLGSRGGTLRHAGEQAADTLLGQLEAPGGAEARLGGHDLTEAGAAVRRLAALVGALESEASSPDRRLRLKDVRQRISTGCESLFSERLTVDLLDPLRTRATAAGPEAGGPERGGDLEQAARGLRALETEARRIGGDKTYDALLVQAAGVVRDVTAQGGLARVEGMRLMEIVAGPEAALAQYGEEG